MCGTISPQSLSCLPPKWEATPAVLKGLTTTSSGIDIIMPVLLIECDFFKFFWNFVISLISARGLNPVEHVRASVGSLDTLSPFTELTVRGWTLFLCFSELFVPIARNFDCTKTPRQLLLSAYDCRLPCPILSNIPLKKYPSIYRSVVSCEELLLSGREVETFRWGDAVRLISAPQLSTNLDHCSTS